MPTTVAKLGNELPTLEEENAKHKAESMEPNIASDKHDEDDTGSDQTTISSSVITIGMMILASRRPKQCSNSCSLLKQAPNLVQPYHPSSDTQITAITEQLESLHCEGESGVCIEVRGHPAVASDSTPSSSLLIEQWNLQIVTKRPSATGHTSLSFLSQAVKSFLYFSQISSWAVSCGGTLPFTLAYRLCLSCSSSQQSFTHCPPEIHSFPLVSLSSHCWLQVSVAFLPRLDEIPALLLPSQPSMLDEDSENYSNTTVLDKDETPNRLHVADQVPSQDEDNTTTPSSSFSHITFASDNVSPKTSKLLFSKMEELVTAIAPDSTADASKGSHDAFPFSPPTPSPLSPKLLTGLSSLLNHSDKDQPQMVTNEKEQNGATKFPSPSCSSNSPSALNSSRVMHRATIATSSSVSLRCCPVRPPGASSPVPALLRPRLFTRESEPNDKRLKRRSCGINITPVRLPPVRSMSLPSAVPNLCLLGSFEESVLNGRIEPFGYVEGFTAELGASGSFCPDHLTLPVTASYFDLSDDGGPSPYLGHIDLSGVGKRGYHVPRKGTIQLTLFNPNKMVVKMFVVTYNYSDMPANSSTFIRQKTLSKPCHMNPRDTTLPSLHYLIHLRFLCSKSGRVYLHTDLKLIFARRAPDTDPDLSRVSLYTRTEGPVDPKYCSLRN